MVDFESLKKQILAMKLGERATIYTSDDGTQINVLKPMKVPASLKNKERYDPKKNFRILLLKKGKEEFAPNHLRLLVDLELKKRADPHEAEQLFDAIEEIYNGTDPKKYRRKLRRTFKGEIETSFTDLCLSQLFMLEQEINYDFGKVKPPRAYIMGYIRMIRSGEYEIDKLLWGATKNPPPARFRSANFE